ncbi:MAG: Nif3-like dinuclear metal center hexameric protein [Bacteroidota bacterium]|nr:Nif3-like dinuclear metal center hexameric protein [Candidatus Kapabacteria bacterium]MDW8220903.1 Nif3-like dinuclear metal center hexameric protein [Bacteroidota bacterium]
MIDLCTFVQSLERYLPPDTAMKGDRIGLQLQSGRTDISSVLVTMELTEEIAEEAIRTGSDCIVAFHPLIFTPVTSLTQSDRVGRICTLLIAHKIALVIAHTNFDAFPRGTSALLAERLGVRIERQLIENAQHPGFGIGVVGILDTPQPVEDFIAHLHTISCAPIRYTLGRSTLLHRIAVVGGSGASFFDAACAAGVDAYITADIKYHDFHRARGHLTLIDAGHYETEQFVSIGLASLVEHIAAEHQQLLTVRRSTIVPNPIRYYPHTCEYRSQQERVLIT